MLPEMRVVRWMLVPLLCLALGCAAPYQVLRALPDGPLATPTRVTVLPVKYSGLVVGDLREDVYVAQHEDVVGWAAKKARWGERLRQAVVAHGMGRHVAAASDAGSGLIMEITVPFIEPGFDSTVMSRPSRTRAVARLRLAGTDQVLYEAVSETSHGGAGDRVGDDHAVLGKFLARFLNEQLRPAAR